jgi:PIN domain nuclease of toxin-antitoxin system
MRVLLDTHLLLWSLAAPERLSKAARRIVDEAEVHVSAASIWEISIKVSIGKMRGNPQEIVGAIEAAGFAHLPVTSVHAAAVANLAPVHKDPFDRMLVAQALSEPMILLTNDSVLAGYGPFVTVA